MTLEAAILHEHQIVERQRLADLQREALLQPLERELAQMRLEIGARDCTGFVVAYRPPKPRRYMASVQKAWQRYKEMNNA